MEFNRSTSMILILIVALGISLFYFVPIMVDAQQNQKTFVTHNGAILKTSGDVLDPIYTASTMEFDPMKYLREFNYGDVTSFPDGTVLREFTIIAEDDKLMEISPGVFLMSGHLTGQFRDQL